MSRENPLWGAPRIHGELLKLGIKVSQATVSKYMARLPKPPSQSWRTFLRNHVDCLASIDFFVLPTATFRPLFVFIRAVAPETIRRQDRLDIPIEIDALPIRGGTDHSRPENGGGNAAENDSGSPADV